MNKEATNKEREKFVKLTELGGLDLKRDATNEEIDMFVMFAEISGLNSFWDHSITTKIDWKAQ